MGVRSKLRRWGGELRRGHALLGGSGSMLSKVGGQLPPLPPSPIPLSMQVEGVSTVTFCAQWVLYGTVAYFCSLLPLFESK